MNYKLLSQYLLLFFMKSSDFKTINKFIKKNGVNKCNFYKFNNEILKLLINWSSAESIAIKKMLKELNN